MDNNNSTPRSGKGQGKRRGNRQSGNHRVLPESIGSRAQFNVPMTVTFPPHIIGFPDRLITILKYSETINFNGSATPSAQKYAMNSLFDPNNSGVGHQPSYYDTLTGIYARYFVRQFKVDIEVQNTLTSVGSYVVLCYSDQDESGNTVEQLIEAKYSVYKTLGIATGNRAVTKLSLPWMQTNRLMGQPLSEPDVNMYSGTGSSPADVAWAFVKASATDGTTSINLTARAVLHFEVIMKDLLPQVSS